MVVRLVAPGCVEVVVSQWTGLVKVYFHSARRGRKPGLFKLLQVIHVILGLLYHLNAVPVASQDDAGACRHGLVL